MAIKISGSTIIDDSRVLINTGNVGVGTTNPDTAVDSGNTGIVHAGIVTANVFYGDGSNLTNITANVQVNSQQLISTPVFPVLTNEIGTASSIGIATTGSNPLVFIPSTGRLGVGTIDPQAKIHVVGVSTFDGDAMFINDNGIKFGGVGNTSITIQYNSTTNSLDFVVSS